ncbi:MAG: isocitrate lyase/PEP mutase family protein [Bosea sp.]|uniref:isocitrate lyase/phosphoenolpyruvate mutase family protein n=1 Tax=Bosea sp. (in: a-proteobacteria) TaxID=1871050 RepID=UPI0008304A99|nr:isocitrate lyase/PEP mutase family protein [Bosea sp. (in: a-proteobacteria)]MCP4736922.1 isocitrate lyase/PEP mutase family protein [Bosea sp. (in: a-proteobacteria)]MDX3805037.1 isocitrate lyase/PEP mutase family protein [Bosea sp. (in: a-proteobacteria)]
MSRSARFRELLRTPPFVCMGAHDAVTAKLAEQAGAPAIYVSGFVASAIVAGAPDVGLLSQTEMFEHIRRICRVTSVPVFADADTGYGGVLDAARTISLWEEAGASVLHLEDQAVPKKCGHFAGKQLVSPEEMQQKLRAMLDARRDPNFFIVARTDSLAVTGLDDAIARLTGYAHVGADGLYVDAIESVEQMKQISDRLRPLGKPLLFNMVRSGKSPFLSLKEVYELGFDYALCPVEPMLAMHKAVKTMMERFMAEGCSTNAVADLLTPFEDFNEFVGLSEMVAREQSYAS